MRNKILIVRFRIKCHAIEGPLVIDKGRYQNFCSCYTEFLFLNKLTLKQRQLYIYKVSDDVNLMI